MRYNQIPPEELVAVVQQHKEEADRLLHEYFSPDAEGEDMLLSSVASTIAALPEHADPRYPEIANIARRATLAAAEAAYDLPIPFVIAAREWIRTNQQTRVIPPLDRPVKVIPGERPKRLRKLKPAIVRGVPRMLRRALEAKQKGKS